MYISLSLHVYVYLESCVVFVLFWGTPLRDLLVGEGRVWVGMGIAHTHMHGYCAHTHAQLFHQLSFNTMSPMG